MYCHTELREDSGAGSLRMCTGREVRRCSRPDEKGPAAVESCNNPRVHLIPMARDLCVLLDYLGSLSLIIC